MNPKIINIIAAQLGVNPAQINADSGPKYLSQWDSIKMLTIVSEIEEVFQISIEPNEIESIDSVKKVLEIVERKAGK
jgi:acyl carrier protein